MQGLSGSGKSTYVNKLVQSSESFAVCSADDFFMVEGVYQFDPSKLGEAHGECLRKCIKAMLDKTQLVIIDNTNTTTEEVSPYMALANAYGYEAVILKVDAAPDVCAKRNTHGVPQQAILGMAARIATFKSLPWWNYQRV